MKRICFVLATLTLCIFVSCGNPANGTEAQNQNGNNESSDSGNTASDSKVIKSSGIKFDFSGAKAIARLEKEDTPRAASSSGHFREYVKIKEHGEMEDAVIVEDNCHLAEITDIHTSPVDTSKDVFIVLKEESVIAYEEDESGEGKKTTAGQLICVHEDGSIADILAYKDEDNNIIHMNLKKESLVFDGKGIAYFICSYKDNSDMIFQYDSQNNKLENLVAEVDGITYSKMQMDKEGEWIFVSGSSGNKSFLRALPVSNPNTPVNLFYSSNAYVGAPYNWVYDDNSGIIFFVLQDGDNLGLFKATKNGGFKDKTFIAEHTSTEREDYEPVELFESSLLSEDERSNGWSNFSWNSDFIVEKEFSASALVNSLIKRITDAEDKALDISFLHGYSPENVDSNGKPMSDYIYLSSDMVDIRFDAFANDSEKFKTLYELTKGKKNEEIFEALNNWIGMAVLFDVLNDSRYKVEYDWDYPYGYAMPITETARYNNNFLADTVYVKGTDILLKDYDEKIITYYKDLTWNSEKNAYDFIERVDVTGKDCFRKNENGAYLTSGTGDDNRSCIINGFSGKPEKPSILCYSFTKNYSEILDYLYSFCNIDGEKEFNLTYFENDENYSSLYTTLKDEKALEWIDADLERRSLFAKALGLYRTSHRTYENDDPKNGKIIDTYVNEINCDSLISFIAKTCYLKGTENSAVSWNVIENYYISYSSVPAEAVRVRGEDYLLFVNDTGVYFECTNMDELSYYLVQVAEPTGRIVERIKKVELPKGKVVDHERSKNRFVMKIALVGDNNSELGYQHLYAVDLDSGEIINCFDSLPNKNELEVISFSCADSLLYFSAVSSTNATSVENYVVDLTTNSCESLGVKRKMLAIFTF